MAHRRMKSKSRKARRGEKSIRDFVIRDFERFGWKVPKSWRRAASQEKRRRRGHKRRRARKWIQGAINPKHKGWLHRKLGVPQGKKIPMRLLLKAKRMGGVMARRAQFAINMRKFQRRRRRRSR